VILDVAGPAASAGKAYLTLAGVEGYIETMCVVVANDCTGRERGTSKDRTRSSCCVKKKLRVDHEIINPHERTRIRS
tara:strand:- start:569 stop:799 length:231 start_codon:yes stop_codon:yes gene_type:complete